MTTQMTQNAPAALERDEGTETYLAARLGATVPTAADVAELLRSRPRFGAPSAEVAAWVRRKEDLVAAIEDATRRRSP